MIGDNKSVMAFNLIWMFDKVQSPACPLSTRLTLLPAALVRVSNVIAALYCDALSVLRICTVLRMV